MHFESDAEPIKVLAGATSISDLAEKAAREETVKGQISASATTIKETKAPDGYTLDKTPHSLEITFAYDSTNKKPVWTYKIDGTDTTVAQGDQYVVLEVVNKKTSSLPETGGIGTVGFYAAGAALLAAGAALVVIKKKTGSDNA